MIYEYRCTKCEHIFTREFPFTENPHYTPCPECGFRMATRYFGTAPPVQFRGSGWASKSELDVRDPQNDSPQDFSGLTGE